MFPILVTKKQVEENFEVQPPSLQLSLDYFSCAKHGGNGSKTQVFFTVYYVYYCVRWGERYENKIKRKRFIERY
jgi:hypothetical protein